jgi:hypothetical protein
MFDLKFEILIFVLISNLLTASDYVGKASGKRRRRGMYIVLIRKSSRAPSGATSERESAAQLGLRKFFVSDHL